MQGCFLTQKKVREKSRECHNHKPQHFPDPKRKRRPTNPNKLKPNKRTKSTKISSLFSGLLCFQRQSFDVYFTISVIVCLYMYILMIFSFFILDSRLAIFFFFWRGGGGGGERNCPFTYSL